MCGQCTVVCPKEAIEYGMHSRDLLRYTCPKRIEGESDRGGEGMNNEKVYPIDFAKVYPLLVNKAVRKGRTQAEVDEMICWLAERRR